MATVAVSAGKPVVVAGHEHTCALTAAGGVKCWGKNAKGQLGNGTTVNSSKPVDVVGLAGGVVALAAGWEHSCALTSAGGVKCWGFNNDGRLGTGNFDPSTVPVDVVGLGSGVTAITASRYTTCALTVGGGVKCWGYNKEGELGNRDSDVFSPVPVAVTGLTSGVTVIASADSHTCALTTGGGVKCWGYNLHGQLGNGTTDDAFTPVDVVGLSSGVTAIAGGGFHYCALTAVGVRCWGLNQFGQLGNGNTTSARTPVAVKGLDAGVVDLTAGMGHSCARTQGGLVQCWGWNVLGQLGSRTSNANVVTPVAPTGLSSGVLGVSAGGAHTCAQLATGIKCWGLNESGQLGDGGTQNSTTPVDVVGLD